MHLKFIKTQISAQSQQSDFTIPSMCIIELTPAIRRKGKEGLTCVVLTCANRKIIIKSIVSKFNSTFSTLETDEHPLFSPEMR